MPAGWENVPRKCGLLHSYALLKASSEGQALGDLAQDECRVLPS